MIGPVAINMTVEFTAVQAKCTSTEHLYTGTWVLQVGRRSSRAWFRGLEEEVMEGRDAARQRPGAGDRAV